MIWALVFTGSVGLGDDKRPAVYRQVAVEQGVFAGDDVAMLEQEKKSTATQIAAFVANELGAKAGKGERASAALAERMMGLALNLDPRNRAAVVVNVQMGRGVEPTKIEAEYSKEVLSQLLVTRAKLLREQEGAANLVLAGFLFAVAVEIDPRNEDAIYEHEMYRLDEAALDWGLLTTVVAAKP